MFGCSWHLVHRPIVHAPGNTMQPENLASDPDTLVEMLWEWLPRDEAAHALADTDVSILKDNLALTDDHQGGAVALHALKDVVLHSL